MGIMPKSLSGELKTAVSRQQQRLLKALLHKILQPSVSHAV